MCCTRNKRPNTWLKQGKKCRSFIYNRSPISCSAVNFDQMCNNLHQLCIYHRGLHLNADMIQMTKIGFVMKMTLLAYASFNSFKFTCDCDGGGMKGGDNWGVSAQWSGAGDDGGCVTPGLGQPSFLDRSPHVTQSRHPSHRAHTRGIWIRH